MAVFESTLAYRTAADTNGAAPAGGEGSAGHSAARRTKSPERRPGPSPVVSSYLAAETSDPASTWGMAPYQGFCRRHSSS